MNKGDDFVGKLMSWLHGLFFITTNKFATAGSVFKQKPKDKQNLAETAVKAILQPAIKKYDFKEMLVNGAASVTKK